MLYQYHHSPDYHSLSHDPPDHHYSLSHYHHNSLYCDYNQMPTLEQVHKHHHHYPTTVDHHSHDDYHEQVQ